MKKLVIANWKQHKTLEEAVEWCGVFNELLEKLSDGMRNEFNPVTVVICPPAPFLGEMVGLLKSSQAVLGVQDVSPYEDGAHTGSIGISQIKKFSKYAIIGHSERHEDRKLVLQKARLCLDNGVIPIVCFVSSDQYEIINGAIYALEDPQNISQNGVYRAKVSEEIQKLTDEARRFFGEDAILIYGGSVNNENAQELALIKGLNGVLVGNASLNPNTFCDIVGKFSL